MFSGVEGNGGGGRPRILCAIARNLADEAKRFGVHIGYVKLSVDFPSLDLSQCNMLFDVIKHH